MTVYGYARVSTDGQTLDAQVASLKAGAERIFSEKQSGAKTLRAALSKARAALDAGDVLLVTSARRAGQKHQGSPKRAGDHL
jgi:DNA invertase Pin-like site-specific DNA recombinase